MAFKSYRRECEREIEDTLRRKNSAAGTVLENEVKKSIVKEGLVDTGRYLNSITSDSDETGAVAGTNVNNDGFSYPLLLEIGGRYVRSYAPMRKGALKAIPDLKRVYGDG